MKKLVFLIPCLIALIIILMIIPNSVKLIDYANEEKVVYHFNYISFDLFKYHVYVYMILFLLHIVLFIFSILSIFIKKVRKCFYVFNLLIIIMLLFQLLALNIDMTIFNLLITLIEIGIYFIHKYLYYEEPVGSDGPIARLK